MPVENSSQFKHRDITGQRFNKLVAIERIPNTKPTKWLFECDCGNGKEILMGNVVRAKGCVKTCGCMHYFRKYVNPEVRQTGAYRSWQAMKTRCYNRNRPEYPRYGGKGVKVCKEWVNSFANFLKDMGERPEDKSLDRIDNNEDYSKDNCRWATREQQAINKGPYKSGSSKYKGICRTKSGKYRSQVTYRGENYRSKLFTDEKEAALAYDKKAKELFGEFAYLNFPDEV